MFSTTGMKDYEVYILPLASSEGAYGLDKPEAGDNYKIVFIKEGTTRLSINKKQFILTGSNVICLNEKDEIAITDSQSDSIRVVWFKPTIINDGFSYERIHNKETRFSANENQDYYYLWQFKYDIQEKNKIMPLHMYEVMMMENRIIQMKKTLQNQETGYWICKARSFLFEILFCIAGKKEESQDTNVTCSCSDYPDFVVEVIYYLQSFYTGKITIEMLSEVFHTNRTTLLTEFKRCTGKTINQYLAILRVKMSSTLLRDTELTIEEISERCGFQNSSYFSKFFKKNMRYSPSEYRSMYVQNIG